MSIIVQRKTVYSPEDGRVQQIRYYTGRAAADADLQVGDQVEDEQSGDGYVVDDVDRAASPVTTNDLRVDLRKVS